MEVSIFECLANIDKGNVALFDTLSKEQQTSLIKPVVLQQWLYSSTTSKDATAVNMLNNNVNQYIFSLYKHPRLLFNLMCGSGLGRTRRYSYTKRVPNESNQRLSLEIIELHEGCSPREAKSFIRLLNKDDLVEMAIALGYEKPQLTALSKEWKDG
jgi:hypothetical protein